MVGVQIHPSSHEKKSYLDRKPVAAVSAKIALNLACLRVPDSVFVVSLAAAFWAFFFRVFRLLGLFWV
jgi:hypothetical protein